MRRIACLMIVALALAGCSRETGPFLKTVDGRRVPVARFEKTVAEVMDKARIPAISKSARSSDSASPP